MPDAELVPVAGTRQWVETMKDMKMIYNYKEVPGATHGSVIEASIPDIFAFFQAHTEVAEIRCGEIARAACFFPHVWAFAPRTREHHSTSAGPLRLRPGMQEPVVDSGCPAGHIFSEKVGRPTNTAIVIRPARF